MQMLKIVHGTWELLSQSARLIREDVFIREQAISAQDEWDEADLTALHFVMYAGEQAIATARLLPNHSIGRVAVLKDYRGQGYGEQLMSEVIQVARQQQRPYVMLSAQCYATAFYEKLGFKAQGKPYLDCGIEHVEMHLPL